MLDIILGVILIFGAFSGYRKGFVMEVISILAFILGILAGVYLLDWAKEIINQYFDHLGAAIPFIAFILLFIGTIILVNIFGKIIKKTLDLTFFGTFDNLAGALTGVFKWALGISVFLWAASKFNFYLPSHLIEKSMLYSHIQGVAPMVGGWIVAIFPALQEMLSPDPIPDKTV